MCFVLAQKMKGPKWGMLALFWKRWLLSLRRALARRFDVWTVYCRVQDRFHFPSVQRCFHVRSEGNWGRGWKADSNMKKPETRRQLQTPLIAALTTLALTSYDSWLKNFFLSLIYPKIPTAALCTWGKSERCVHARLRVVCASVTGWR